MQIFLASPYHKTGGPENIHLLCHSINTYTHHTAYIYYITPAQPTPLYDYPNIKIATALQDLPDTLLILPEIHPLPTTPFKHLKIIIWWLSYTFAALFNRLDNMKHSAHLFQSYYAYAQVTPHLPPHAQHAFLSDHLHPDFLALPLQLPRTNTVAYNPQKDTTTPRLCHKLGIATLPLQNLTRPQLIDALQTCKIYVDLGFHPGKDRLPREAAMCGCVVITNKAGAAAYQEDIPIDEKISYPEDLCNLLPIVLAHYESYYQKQEPYRQAIKNETLLFKQQIQSLWSNC